MKKFFVAIAVVGVLMIVNSECFGQELNVVTTEFCPYVCDPAKEGGAKGFVIDIFNAVFEKHGYTINYEIQPWVRAMKSFNDRKDFDALIAATKIHPVNKDIALFPETEICMYTHKFYALKDSPLAGKWKYNGVESLKDIVLGGIKGWSYCSAEVTKYVNETPEPKVYAMYGEDLLSRNFNMLLKKRTDLYVENEWMVTYFLYNEKKAGKTYPDNIVAVDSVPVDPGVGESYPVFYNDEKGKKYAEIFTSSMKELRADGKMAEIMARYGLKDWK